MYSLHMPILDDTDKETPIAKKLLKEILGYTDEEVRQFAATMFACCVAKNLSIEQVKLIVKPFNYDTGSLHSASASKSKYGSFTTNFSFINFSPFKVCKEDIC